MASEEAKIIIINIIINIVRLLRHIIHTRQRDDDFFFRLLCVALPLNLLSELKRCVRRSAPALPNWVVNSFVAASRYPTSMTVLAQQLRMESPGLITLAGEHNGTMRRRWSKTTRWSIDDGEGIVVEEDRFQECAWWWWWACGCEWWWWLWVLWRCDFDLIVVNDGDDESRGEGIIVSTSDMVDAFKFRMMIQSWRGEMRINWTVIGFGKGFTTTLWLTIVQQWHSLSFTLSVHLADTECICVVEWMDWTEGTFNPVKIRRGESWD